MSSKFREVIHAVIFIFHYDIFVSKLKLSSTATNFRISDVRFVPHQPHLDIIELPDLREESHVGLGVLVVPELDGAGPVVAPLHHRARPQVVAAQLVDVRRVPVILYLDINISTDMDMDIVVTKN